MKLSELIAAYGDDKVGFQNLDQCAADLNMGKRNTRISFHTDQRLNLKGTEQLGLVIWLDRARVAEIMAAAKASLALTTVEAGAERAAPAANEPASNSSKGPA